MNTATSRKIINLISITGMAFSIALAIYFFRLGFFNDPKALQSLVSQATILGPLVFILIQIFKVKA